jgi:hypothetical protein
VLLRPLPFPQQDRIAELRELNENGRGMSFAEPNFVDLKTRSRSFEALAQCRRCDPRAEPMMPITASQAATTLLR